MKEYDITLTATDHKKKRHRKRRKSEYKYKKHLQKIHSFKRYPPPVDEIERINDRSRTHIASKFFVRANWSLFRYGKKRANRIIRRKRANYIIEVTIKRFLILDILCERRFHYDFDSRFNYVFNVSKHYRMDSFRVNDD